MPIHYRIEENHLKGGTYFARVIMADPVFLDDMLPNIVTKTALSGPDLKAAIAAIREEVINNLVSGHRVVIDGLVSFSLSLKGSFDEADVVLNPSTARLHVLTNDDPSLENEVVVTARYKKVSADIKAPVVNSIMDSATKIFDQYTPGSVICLKGENLKFNPDNVDEGVFVDDGSGETRLSVYSYLTDTQVHTLLLPGINKPLFVTVRARYTDDGQLRGSNYHTQIEPIQAG